MLISIVRPTELSPKTRIAALAGALGYLLLIVGSWYWAYGSLVELGGLLLTAQVGPWLWWVFIGGAMVGGVLAVSLVRYNLLSPLIVVAVVYGVASYHMGKVLQAPEPPLSGTPYDLYFVSWPLILGTAIAIGYLEHRVRSGRSPNEIPQTM